MLARSKTLIVKETIGETEELKYAMSNLKFHSFKGCANVCPKCKKTGHFGSIAKYTTELTGISYLLCGWCREITQVEDEVAKDES